MQESGQVVHNIKLPRQVLLTKSSAGVPWNLATLPLLVSSARNSKLLRARLRVRSARSGSINSRLSALSQSSEDFVITAAAQLASTGVEPATQGSLATSMSLNLAKQAETSKTLASLAAKQQADAQQKANARQQANAQIQAQINAVVAAICSLTQMLEHDLLTLNFGAAIVIGVILIDLNSQLIRLLIEEVN
jgi:hypothetical protein